MKTTIDGLLILMSIDMYWWIVMITDFSWNPLKSVGSRSRSRSRPPRQRSPSPETRRRRKASSSSRRNKTNMVVLCGFYMFLPCFTWLFCGFCQLKMAISHDFASWFECSDPGGPNGRRSAQVTCLETCALNLEFVAETVTAELPRIDKSDKIRQIRDT